MNENDERLYDIFLSSSSEEALLELIKRHRECLTLFINGFVHNMDTAEELMLDTFAEVAAGPTLFSKRSSFKTWLFSIGRNLTMKYLRKVIPTEDIDECDEASSDPPELNILKEERNRQLYKALSKISDDHRRILILLYFEDMTCEEAAQVMGKNRKQIYNLAERGKRALKSELLRMGFEE